MIKNAYRRVLTIAQFRHSLKGMHKAGAWGSPASSPIQDPIHMCNTCLWASAPGILLRIPQRHKQPPAQSRHSSADRGWQDRLQCSHGPLLHIFQWFSKTVWTEFIVCITRAHWQSLFLFPGLQNWHGLTTSAELFICTACWCHKVRKSNMFVNKVQKKHMDHFHYQLPAFLAHLNTTQATLNFFIILLLHQHFRVEIYRGISGTSQTSRPWA